MSRAAVAKHVASLRELGFGVEASTRRGYTLSAWPDRLEPEALLPLLTTRVLGRSYRHLPRCGSTNAEAFMAAMEGAPQGHTITAEEQEAGRGRRGRTWHSPPGTGLYLSVVLRPPLSPQAAAPLTLTCAVAVAEALEAEAAAVGVQASPRLKWPNDIQIHGKKLCGILLELRADPERIDFIVAGVGINVNVEAFPQELAQSSTSLRLATGRHHLRPRLVASVLGAMETWTERFVNSGPKEALEAFRARAVLFGCPVTVSSPEGQLQGVAEGIDDSGALLLVDATGRRHSILAGDVSLREAHRG